jgi:hypothetical protein
MNTSAKARLLLPLLSGGIAGIALCLALGLERGFGGGGLFFLPRELCGGGRSRLRLVGCSCGLLGLPSLARLVASSRLGLTFGLPLLHGGVVGTGLRTKLVENIFPSLERGLLAVGEAGFLESTHLSRPVSFIAIAAAGTYSSFAIARERIFHSAVGTANPAVSAQDRITKRVSRRGFSPLQTRLSLPPRGGASLKAVDQVKGEGDGVTPRPRAGDW